MINLSQICNDAVDENLSSFFKSIKNNPEQTSESRVYEALMRHSELLLTKYHLALKEELAKQGIDL